MPLDFRLIEHLLDSPEQHSDKCVILLPGISDHALDKPLYHLLADSLVKSGISCLRFDAWHSSQDLKTISLFDIHNILSQALVYLKSYGYAKIGCIGKSFGSAVFLTYSNPEIKSLVLWAPTIGFSYNSNLKEALKIPVSNFKSFSAIKINSHDTKKIKCSVLIIQGKKDPLVSRQEAEAIYESLQKAKIDFIDGADHDFSNEEHQKIVVKKTIEFFKKTLI